MSRRRDDDTGMTSFGDVPPGTRYTMDKPGNTGGGPNGGAEFGFDFSAVNQQADATQFMESVNDSIGAITPVDGHEPKLTPQDAARIAAFVEGKTDNAPNVDPRLFSEQAVDPYAPPNPGLLNPNAPQQVFGIPNTHITPNGQTQQQQQHPAPVPGASHQAPVSDPTAALQPMLEAMKQQNELVAQQLQQQQAQNQYLMQQLQQQQQAAYQAQQPQIRYQQIQSAGLDPTDAKDVALYDMYERAAQQQQVIDQLNQRFDSLQYQAHQMVTENAIKADIREQVSSRYGDLKVPAATLDGVARQAAALAGTMDQRQAIEQAMATVAPLLDLAAKAQKAKPETNQAPQQAPQQQAASMHPGLAQLSQLPQFAGANPQQLAGLYQGMMAASIPGQGQVRHQKPVDIKFMDSVLFQ